MNQRPTTKSYQLTIGWLYPELMSTYGDRGNITVFQKRCEWRGINVEIDRLDLGFTINDLEKCDLLFMGGAQDRQQQIVAEDLLKKREALKKMIEEGIPGLYICGAYQFLGKYYREADGTVINGLGIFDLYTENPKIGFSRLTGTSVARVLNNEIIVGFENHGGRTYLGQHLKPFGKVLKGFGNNGKDQTEGAVYKNSFGTYFHGPILPKNPFFADFLIKHALEKKYSFPTCPPSALAEGKCRRVELSPLDDSLETKSHNEVIKKLNIET